MGWEREGKGPALGVVFIILTIHYIEHHRCKRNRGLGEVQWVWGGWGRWGGGGVGLGAAPMPG